MIGAWIQTWQSSFYNYFGGDIFTTKKAVDSLMEKKDNFDPFAVVRCPGLPSCVENASAMAHLKNIAKARVLFGEECKDRRRC